MTAKEYLAQNGYIDRVINKEDLPEFHETLSDLMEDMRILTIIEVQEQLLKQMIPMIYENNYPSFAVPHATILELPALMGIKQ